MVAAQPQFLLFCDAHVNSSSHGLSVDKIQGRWHFMLERLDGPERLEVTDSERAQPPDRLALLAVVRGLEALEQPSQVTLITTSRYVSRGLRYGLSEWREADYSWEHFGVQKPIRNADLWQRIDGAMQFHRVACRLLESSLSATQQVAADEIAEIDNVEDIAPGSFTATAIITEEELAPLHSTRQVDGNQAVRTDNRSIGDSWWDMAAGWRHWWSGRALRPTALAGV